MATGTRLLSASGAIAAALLYTTAIAAHAGTVTVTNTRDRGPGSLRQALADANAALILINSTFSGNSAVLGGCVFNT